MAMLTPMLILSLTSATVAFVLGWVVLRADATGRMNRRLAALLATEGILIAIVGYTATAEVALEPPWPLLLSVALVADAAAHLLFLATLDTPVGRALASRAGQATITILSVAVVAQVALATTGIYAGLGNDDAAAWIFLGLASVFALVASLDAWRRTAKGTAAHRRATWFAAAFGARDLIFALAILAWGLADAAGAMEVRTWAETISAAAPLVLVGLLTYGILSTQLFDIDLRIKWGISRSTVVTVAIIAVLAALKTAEYTFNRTLGAVAAGLVAGIVLVLAPRLNKLGDKVANVAMPHVQPTSDYLTFKKLEVYRAAVESAQETGGINEKDRASLDRLRAKLGLKEADAKAIEADVLAPA